MSELDADCGSGEANTSPTGGYWRIIPQTEDNILRMATGEYPCRTSRGQPSSVLSYRGSAICRYDRMSNTILLATMEGGRRRGRPLRVGRPVTFFPAAHRRSQNSSIGNCRSRGLRKFSQLVSLAPSTVNSPLM